MAGNEERKALQSEERVGGKTGAYERRPWNSRASDDDEGEETSSGALSADALDPAWLPRRGDFAGSAADAVALDA